MRTLLLIVCALSIICLASCSGSTLVTATATSVPNATRAPDSHEAATRIIVTFTTTPTAVPIQTVEPRPLTTSPACPPIGSSTQLPVSNDGKEYLGRFFDHWSLPSGLTELEWISAGSLDYAWVKLQRGDTQMYWLAEARCRDSRGNAYFEVADVLMLPHLEKDQNVSDFCEQVSSEVLLIVAVGIYDKEQSPMLIHNSYYGWQLRNIRHAWGANFGKMKFVDMPTKNLTCFVYVGSAFSLTPSMKP